MKKAVLEAMALKHLGRWHKTNIEEELMKARAFIAALIAQEESADIDDESLSLKDAEKIGTLWRTTSGRLQIQLGDE
jgi:hypothetical protein